LLIHDLTGKCFPLLQACSSYDIVVGRVDGTTSHSGGKWVSEYGREVIDTSEDCLGHEKIATPFQYFHKAFGSPRSLAWV